MKETEYYRAEQRKRDEMRWALPRKRRRRRSPEDDCRHCAGSGACADCGPTACRVCRGTGLQPADTALITRLSALWDGAA